MRRRSRPAPRYPRRDGAGPSSRSPCRPMSPLCGPWAHGLIARLAQPLSPYVSQRPAHVLMGSSAVGWAVTTHIRGPGGSGPASNACQTRLKRVSNACQTPVKRQSNAGQTRRAHPPSCRLLPSRQRLPPPPPAGRPRAPWRRRASGRRGAPRGRSPNWSKEGLVKRAGTGQRAARKREARAQTSQSAGQACYCTARAGQISGSALTVARTGQTQLSNKRVKTQAGGEMTRRQPGPGGHRPAPARAPAAAPARRRSMRARTHRDTHRHRHTPGRGRRTSGRGAPATGPAPAPPSTWPRGRNKTQQGAIRRNRRVRARTGRVRAQDAGRTRGTRRGVTWR